MVPSPEEVPPTVSLGVRVAVFACLCVLGAVLVTALVVELKGRAESHRIASEALGRAHSVAASRLARDGQSLERLAATVARDPKFFALLALRRSERTATYRHSLEGVIRDFQADTHVEIFDVTDEWGATVAASSRPAAPEPSRGNSPLVRRALAGSEALGFRLEGGRLYRIAVVPVLAGERAPIGTLTLGAPIDDSFAAAIRGATGADIILLAGETPAQGGPVAAAHPIVTTLSAAAARSILETLGPSPRSVGRARLRDERNVSLAKSPAVALDVSLDGAMEGGAARLIVVAPLDLEATLSPSRETLLAAGSLAAIAALCVGFVVGRRMSRRIRRLGLAAREAATGNFAVPLPAPSMDEVGLLTVDFGGMREMQRREIDRLQELDRMKTDFLAVAGQDILVPVREIQEAERTLTARAARVLGPEGMKRLRVIRGGADTIATLARDLGGASVVLSAATGDRDASAGAHAAPPGTKVASLTVVPGQPTFHPTSPSARSEPTAPLESATGETAEPLDVATLVESVAVDFIVAGAQRGIEVGIAVEPDLIHPTAGAASLEASLRQYGERAIAELAPGSSVTFAARRTPNAIEVRVEGGASPLLLSLPLPPSPKATSACYK